jgi:hypothetical protein
MIFQLLFYLNHIDQNPELKSNNINPELLLRGSSPTPGAELAESFKT